MEITPLTLFALFVTLSNGLMLWLLNPRLSFAKAPRGSLEARLEMPTGLALASLLFLPAFHLLTQVLGLFHAPFEQGLVIAGVMNLAAWALTLRHYRDALKRGPSRS
ncbi:hypothetical protein Mterra_03540 [Calidithermus terrae]|uniref:Uncharacterized protein n=1 Tax=Calidithermus terrae TaxID=1408545 RepID=A0A399E9M4_9DEIN|nr:hypothetical protein [Calidithermus terrae]RIH80193.1 hypothetical protein Mterra_03540 [Calidithermus terrae]